jgi:hypothetical protein
MTPPPPRLSVNDPEGKVPAARALEVVAELIKTGHGRKDYKKDPLGAFDKEKERLGEPFKSTKYDDIPQNARAALQELSEDELKVLAKLEKTFIDDGLFVDVPSPGKLFYK